MHYGSSDGEPGISEDSSSHQSTSYTRTRSPQTQTHRSLQKESLSWPRRKLPAPRLSHSVIKQTHSPVEGPVWAPSCLVRPSDSPQAGALPRLLSSPSEIFGLLVHAAMSVLIFIITEANAHVCPVSKRRETAGAEVSPANTRNGALVHTGTRRF